MKRLFCLAVVLLFSGSAFATDLSNLYSDDTLHYWQKRYQPNIEANFYHLLLGSLTSAERKKLGVVRLALPLRGPGTSAGNPLNFFARGNTVVIPVQSIHFFDELAQAFGYAWSNNLNLEHITNYLSILKYQKPPHGGFPPPLKALGIRQNAWKSDKKMDDASQKILKSAIVFVMAHELAHIYYRHPGYGPQVTAAMAQANEMDADHFANEMMHRIGVPPSGMVQMFMAFAHYSTTRGDFNSDQAWEHYLQTSATHPVTAARLRAMANDLLARPDDFSATEIDLAAGKKRVIYLATQIEGIADILDNPKLQRFISGKAQGLRLESLKYHQKKQIVANTGRRYSGNYKGNFLHMVVNASNETLTIAVSLRRNGNRVTGTFDFGFGLGTIEGLILNNELRIQWLLGNAYGQGVLMQRSGEKELNGTIGYGAATANAGEWHLQQQ